MKLRHFDSTGGSDSAIPVRVDTCTSQLSDREGGPPQERFYSGEAPQAESSLPAQRVLLIEDNEGDVFLIKEAITQHGMSVNLDVISDGEQAISFIDQVDEGVGDPPDVFLLDLNLPRRSGEEVLSRIAHCTKCAQSRILIVTSSDSQRDRARTAALGATRYFRKPLTYEAFMTIGRVIKELLAGLAEGSAQ